MSPFRVLIAILTMLLPGIQLFAQAPPNDNCQNAYDIPVGNGYGIGKFISNKANLNKAGRQPGESIDSLLINAGNDKKTVWYRFETKTRRSVSIQLRQMDSAITQNAVGLVVYRTDKCLPNPGMVSTYLPAISKFGSSVNTCLQEGVYYVQVCANNTAKDSIWLELTLDVPSPNDYDKAKDAYDFGVIGTGVKSISLHAGCQSIDSVGELNKDIGANYKDFNQSAWFTFTTPGYIDVLLNKIDIVNTQGFNDTVFIGYQLFEGDAKTDVASLKSVGNIVKYTKACDPAKYMQCQSFKPVFGCALKANKVYSIKLLFRKDADFDLNLDINILGDHGSLSFDRQKLPNAYKLGTLRHNVPVTISDQLGCNAHIQANSCFSTLSGLVIDTNKYGIIDTFDLNSWFTFRVSSRGIVFKSTSGTKCFNYRLFKGDASKSCNLILLESGYFSGNQYQNCSDSGVYSIQILYKSKYNNNPELCNSGSSTMYNNYIISMAFDSAIPKPSGIHYRAALAEDMGDITTKVVSGVKSLPEYCTSPGDSVVIAGKTYKSNFIFRQFYISSPLYLNIIDLTKSDCHYLIFNGKATDGLNTLSPTSSLYVGKNGNIVIASNGCKPFPPGWYTIFAYYEPYYCDYFGLNPSTLQILAKPPCYLQFDKPYKAADINKGVPLDYGPNTGKPNAPIFQNLYNFPTECAICADTPLPKFVNICNTNKKYQRISYYVFTIKRESSITLNDTYNNYGITFFLYKDDVRRDSIHLNDPAYFISGCGNMPQYCRLNPGTYTVISLTNEYPYLNSPAIIAVDTVGYAPNDFASQAYDIGIIPSNNTPVSTPYHSFYCTTSATNSDPSYGADNYSFNGVFSVPSKMNTNYFTGQRVLRNLWYTFQAVGSGYITIKADHTSSSRNISFNNLPYLVLKSNDGGKTFSQLKSDRKIDSTKAQGLIVIKFGDLISRQSISFSKPGCDTVRYYIILQSFEAFSSYSFTVQFDGIPTNDSADYCYNAKQLSLTGAGTATTSVPVNCHTMGEGYGEDGSNMGCLINDKTKAYGTSWFLFHLKGAGKYDISFSILNKTDASSQDVRFRVLYGSCNAMTPALCVENAYAGFTMDCMSAGDYYIQVITPHGAVGRVELNATATVSKFPFCKPFSLIKPIANFLANGGCNGRAVSFSNLSTAGSDIQYRWDFGDGAVSTLKSPVHSYKVSSPITKFNVRLIVTNTANSLQDTIIIPVYLYRDLVKVDIGKDTTILCGQDIHLHAHSNYNDAIYHWSPSTGMGNPYDSDQVVHPNWDMKYILTTNIENCTVTDSILVKVSKHVDIKGKRYLCNGSSVRLSIRPGYSYYNWYFLPGAYGIFISSDSFLVINKAGKYAVQVGNGNCYANDTIYVYNLGKDTLPETIKPMCLGDTTVITSPLQDPSLHYKWSNGDTLPSIVARDTGKYVVNISNSQCGSNATIHVVQKKYMLTLPKQDSVVCENVLPYLLKVNTDAPNILWSTGDTARAIKLKKAGWYSIKVGKGHCAEYDSMHIRIAVAPPKPYIGNDTTICSNQSFTLDAGLTGLAYLWSTGETTKRINTRDSGIYTLTVSNGQCTERASRHVRFKDVYLQLGKDTFYCKGQQLILNPKSNCTDYLWSTGESKKAIYANDPGQYWVKGTRDECILSDTINVRLSYPPIVHLGKDTLICDSFDMVLDAGQGYSYQWYPGGETSRRIFIKKHGPYTVIVKNIYGCTGSDTIRILEDCDPTIFVPNAFHAFKDDPNEFFKAYGTYISYFEMKIYNRWGERLWQTENINNGWDGRYKGQLCEDGVYLYVIHYKGRYTNKQLTGTFHLLR